MPDTYVHHRIATAPRQWRAVADAMAGDTAALAAAGGALYGIWRSQIGRPRDELTAITVWPDAASAAAAADALGRDLPHITEHEAQTMVPTLRPGTPSPPVRQGNYAFRWSEAPEADWPAFLDLCAAAWPGFEGAYDSQVIGLWECVARTPTGAVRSLLLTRRPNLAMWERSKLPQGAEEAAVRATLSRRYDLCEATWVHTTTLLTAADAADTARWT